VQNTGSEATRVVFILIEKSALGNTKHKDRMRCATVVDLRWPQYFELGFDQDARYVSTHDLD
jgi:hypothetical protein